MRLRRFGLVLGVQIVAQDHLDIDTCQPTRDAGSSSAPEEKFLIQAGGHPFRIRPVVDNRSVHPEITKITDGRHAIAFQRELRPGIVGQIVNPVAVEDGDIGLHQFPGRKGSRSVGPGFLERSL